MLCSRVRAPDRSDCVQQVAGVCAEHQLGQEPDGRHQLPVRALTSHLDTTIIIFRVFFAKKLVEETNSSISVKEIFCHICILTHN